MRGADARRTAVRTLVLVIGACVGCAPSPAERLATVHPLECPTPAHWARYGAGDMFERACVTDDLEREPIAHRAHHGPSVFVRTGAAAVTEYAWWDSGELRVQRKHAFVGGAWSTVHDVAFDAASQRGHVRRVLVRVHGAVDAYRIDGDMPGGTGTFTASWPGYVAGGACREGLRDGTWTVRDVMGTTTATRTYREGQLDGPQQVPDEAGLARDGRRVGAWTIRRKADTCARSGRPGSQCGFLPCEAPWTATLTVLYGDAGAPSVQSATWDPMPGADAPSAEPPSSAPPAEIGLGELSCLALANTTGPALP
jgi:hypothetical protein